jgi:hypothetical protein
MTLHVAPRFHLPLDVITDTIAFLARKGGGKTYSAGVFVEEMLNAEAQVVVLDPIGNWWALRIGAGTHPGYEVPVFGGQHGDIPLGAHAGAIVADFVVDFGSSLILDVSGFTLSDQRRFVTDFVTRLLQCKKNSPSPMHLVLEEAQEFVPQKVYGEQTRMVSAVQRLIKLGRNYGIGCSLISQRAASVNKDALTQTEVLCVLQTTSPQDRKAIRDWIDHVGADKAKKVIDELPKLKPGQMHLWSPGRDLYRKVKFRRKQTLDASATPKVGVKRKTHTPTPIDLVKVEKAMGAAVEQAKQNDPGELRKQIHGLKAQLQQRPMATVTAEPQIVERIVEVPALTVDLEQRLHDAVGQLQAVVAEVQADLDAAGLESAKTREFAALPQAERPFLKPDDPTVREVAREAVTEGARVKVSFDSPPPTDNGVKLKRGARVMLGAAALFHPRPMTRAQISTLAGYSMKSSTFDAYMTDLRRAGFIRTQHGTIEVTAAGIKYLGPDRQTVPPTTADLVALWGSKLKKGARRMLQEIVSVYPKTISRERLGEALEKSSTFDAYLTDLRRNGLMTSDSGAYRASDELFPV